MEHSGSNTKNWIYRLRHLNIRRRSRSSDNSNNDEFLFQRSLPSNISENPSNCPRTKNSFRRSLRKMHTRVKDCVFRQKSRHLNHKSTNNVSTSSQSPRITLGTPATHTENIYSFDPVQNRASITDQDIGVDRILVQSDRNGAASEVNTHSAVSSNEQRTEKNNGSVPKNEVLSLAHHYWYWGPISVAQAEERLKGAPDGSFLIRDSSSERYIFALSFRSVGKTLHSRIEYTRGGYILFNSEGYSSITDLVEHALAVSKDHVYCYTKNGGNNPNFPVRLIWPVSRYNEVRSLKHLTRFVIRQYVNINDIKKLPLPSLVIKYLQEETIF